MAKQYRIEITYNDETTEEYIIHSDKTVEWVDQQKQKTAEAFVDLFATSIHLRTWLQSNLAKKIEITEEDET